MSAVQEGIDTLASLEQRITHAVELLNNLRGENQQLRVQLNEKQEQLHALAAERDQFQTVSAEFQKANSDLAQQVKTLSQELDELRSERKQVKARIEKLLSQMDLLSAS